MCVAGKLDSVKVAFLHDILLPGNRSLTLKKQPEKGIRETKQARELGASSGYNLFMSLSWNISPGGAGKATSGLKECQQVGVELVFVRVREAVGRARVDLQGRVLDELR